MKKKTFSPSNIIFVVFLALLIFPQTRTPIQVAVNRAKMYVLSPSVIATEEQEPLGSFDYLLHDIAGVETAIPVGSGKVVFISYWATWCPPCIAELPSIQEVYKDYGTAVDFVLITQEDPNVVSAFMKKKGFELPVYFPSMQTPKALYDTSIPTSFIIDAKGNIILKETGAVDWNSATVRGLLDSLIDT